MLNISKWEKCHLEQLCPGPFNYLGCAFFKQLMLFLFNNIFIFLSQDQKLEHSFLKLLYKPWVPYYKLSNKFTVLWALLGDNIYCHPILFILVYKGKTVVNEGIGSRVTVKPKKPQFILSVKFKSKQNVFSFYKINLLSTVSDRLPTQWCFLPKKITLENI